MQWKMCTSENFQLRGGERAEKKRLNMVKIGLQRGETTQNFKAPRFAVLILCRAAQLIKI